MGVDWVKVIEWLEIPRINWIALQLFFTGEVTEVSVGTSASPGRGSPFSRANSARMLSISFC